MPESGGDKGVCDISEAEHSPPVELDLLMFLPVESIPDLEPLARRRGSRSLATIELFSLKRAEPSFPRPSCGACWLAGREHLGGYNQYYSRDDFFL